MATTTSAFGTAADDAAVGTLAWTNPNNAKDNNDVYATAAAGAGSEQTHYLKLTAPSALSIPAGALINGVTVTIHRKGSASVGSTLSARDAVISLVKAGTVQGDNKADTATNWPVIEASVAYGSGTDTWGILLVPGDFSAGFGVVISANINDTAVAGFTASVDYVEVTVTYTAGYKPPTTQAIFFGA